MLSVELEKWGTASLGTNVDLQQNRLSVGQGPILG